MTVGALYQIKNYNTNSANNFLELNPQISFFKTVYRKHSRFALENIAINELSRSKLSFNETVIITCDIPRNGDLLKNLFFTFELPDIYSGSFTDSTNNITENYNFQWIKNIGTNIFNYVALKINDQIIDKLYGDYINIWKELCLNNTEKNTFNQNIGHEAELYDPKNGLGQNGKYPNAIDSGTNTNAEQSARWENHNYKVLSNSNLSLIDNISNVFPSILGRKIKVPLPFSFCLNSGLAIPLIALQYCIVSIELEMKPFKDLYTIIDPDSTNVSIDGTSINSFRKRVKPSTSNSNHEITNFTLNYDYNIKPNIECEYVFLDQEERKRFALYDHEYLIEQTKLVNKDGVELKTSVEQTETKVMPAFNPVKYLTWVVKRDDMSKINEWNNYSNWVNENVPPYSNAYYYEDRFYNLIDNKEIFFNPKSTVVNHQNLFNKENLKRNILTGVKLEFDGNSRIDKNIEYFEGQQIYQHFKTNPKKGIYVYSFSLNPLDFQPSGNCNFSNIYNVKMFFKKNIQENLGSMYNYRAYIYTISYNILVIKNGTANLKFVN